MVTGSNADWYFGKFGAKEMGMEKQSEPACTPRAEYQCDGSTTHYQGCKCHEARWQVRVAELESDYKAANRHANKWARLAAWRSTYIRRLEARLKEAEDALEFYADENRYRTQFHPASCGCCSTESEPEIYDEWGKRARAYFAKHGRSG